MLCFLAIVTPPCSQSSQGPIFAVPGLLCHISARKCVLLKAARSRVYYDGLMVARQLTVAVTGGGSGGHANPAMALIDGWRHLSGAATPEFHYIGSHTGIEAQLARSRRIPYHPIPTGKLRRYLSFQNFLDLFRVAAGAIASVKLLWKLKPDVVFSTGGFVSVPVVVAAWLLRIPVLAHEQTTSSGLANRIAGRIADRIAVSFESSASQFPASKVILTGIPLRRSLFEGDGERFRRGRGFPADLPLIYVTGGAQGSRVLNEAVLDQLPRLLQEAIVVHQVGRHPSYDALALAESRQRELPPHLAARYLTFQYMDSELGDLLAAATLLIGRSGAGTVCEAMALAIPCVLVPLSTSAGDEQRKNARLLTDAGQATLIEEADLTGDLLADTVEGLVRSPDKLDQMRAAAKHLHVPGAIERIASVLQELASQNSRRRDHRG